MTMSDIDTSTDAVKLLAAELCARWDDVFEFLKMREQAAATLRALAAERDRLREALTKIATSSKQLPGQMFVAFACEAVTREALKEPRHD